MRYLHSITYSLSSDKMLNELLDPNKLYNLDFLNDFLGIASEVHGYTGVS